jgi:arylsulfatase A-like enzyme
LTRRLVAALVPLLIGLPFGRPIPVAAGGPVRPNVLIILTDDQRADTMNVMGSTRAWFAQGGARYPNAFATTPMCCPSRSSIFSGMYTHNHGVASNSDPSRLDHTGTMQRFLQDAGYLNGYVGKFLNRWRLSTRPPFFDRSILVEGGRHRRFRAAVNGSVRRVNAYSTNYVTEHAVGTMEWFERRDGDPWFFVVAPTAPHEPFVPEPRYAESPVPPLSPSPAMLERDRTDKPSYVQAANGTLDEARRVRRQQLRMLRSVDDLVGRLRDTMSRLGENNTIAVFTSDNGFQWGEHGLSTKAKPYTASVRVPLLVRWPGHIPDNTVDPRLGANVDIAATILDAVEVSPSAEMDGRSLLSVPPRDRLLLEAEPQDGRVPNWAATRSAEYQYVEYYGETTGAVTFREYYDLGTDPWQLVNLFADRDPGNDPPAEEAARLSAILARDRSCEGTSGPGACP